MNNEDIYSPPRREELQGVLRRAVDAVRSLRPPAESESGAIERASHGVAGLPCAPSRPAVGRSVRWLRPRGWKILWPAAAVAAVLMVCFVFIPGDGKSGNLLAEVFQAFDRAPAYHFVLRDCGPTGQAVPQRTIETWVVRGVGRREEVRTGEKLTSVATDNLRWLFRWDIEDRLVIAAPSRMAEPKKYCAIEDSELLMSRDKCLQWAEQRKATIQIEKDRLEGRSVEKMSIFWPGGQVEDREVVWYDPATHRPLKIHVYSKSFAHASMSEEYEMSIDYPAPATIPANRFIVAVPREARLEISDSQLGRYIRSEGRKDAWPGP
jgi:hypothetical protein